MCECVNCGLTVSCRNPNCTNDECPDCRDERLFDRETDRQIDEQRNDQQFFDRR